MAVTFSSVIIFSYKNYMLNLIKQRRKEAMISYMLLNRSLICLSKPREIQDLFQHSGGDVGTWLWFAWQGDAGF